MRRIKNVLCILFAVIMCCSVMSPIALAKGNAVTVRDLPTTECWSELYTVTAKVLNIRAKASTKAKIKVQLKKGDLVLKNEKTFTDKNGMKWMHIYYGCGDTQSGYAAAAYLQKKDTRYVDVGFSNYNLTVYDKKTGNKTGEKIAAGRFIHFINCAGAQKKGGKTYYYSKIRYDNGKENFVKIAMKNVDMTYYCKMIRFTD